MPGCTKPERSGLRSPRQEVSLASAFGALRTRIVVREEHARVCDEEDDEKEEWEGVAEKHELLM